MWRKHDDRPDLPFAAQADVCLIAEGCYPYVSGGVSSWIDWLIKSHPDLTFAVLAILPAQPDGPPRYTAHPNQVGLYHLRLDQQTFGQAPAWPNLPPKAMARLLTQLLDEGSAADLETLLDILGPASRRPRLDVLLNSPQAWETICAAYERMPHAAFLAYFWAFRTLVGGLFRALSFPLPPARIYHAVSTGYAGLIAARARIETGRPALITEHGIYSNERRIEILMADWIANSIDTGLDLSDEREDIREFWARSFESFAHMAYEAASEVVALYSDNQIFQKALGANPTKLSVIPNGVDIERFAAVRREKPDRPTMAFIGRVTPIKDVHTFVDAAEQLVARFPDLEALVIGPMDEDPDYAQGCVREVERRGLTDTVRFTGPVDVRDYLGRIDVLVLTSISEALPLVILEAGAVGVPCVATDVGACREILEGKSTDRGGPGGMVVPVGSGEDVAEAVGLLLADPAQRDAFGDRLKHRVETQYRAQTIADAYTAFYQRNGLGLAPANMER